MNKRIAKKKAKKAKMIASLREAFKELNLEFEGKHVMMTEKEFNREMEKLTILHHVKEGLKEMKEIQQGKKKAVSSEEIHKELRREGYYN